MSEHPLQLDLGNVRGPAGQGIYEWWKARFPEGTEAEFVEYFRGEKGDTPSDDTIRDMIKDLLRGEGWDSEHINYSEPTQVTLRPYLIVSAYDVKETEPATLTVVFDEDNAFDGGSTVLVTKGNTNVEFSGSNVFVYPYTVPVATNGKDMIVECTYKNGYWYVVCHTLATTQQVTITYSSDDTNYKLLRSRYNLKDVKETIPLNDNYTVYGDMFWSSYCGCPRLGWANSLNGQKTKSIYKASGALIENVSENIILYPVYDSKKYTISKGDLSWAQDDGRKGILLSAPRGGIDVKAYIMKIPYSYVVYYQGDIKSVKFEYEVWGFHFNDGQTMHVYGNTLTVDESKKIGYLQSKNVVDVLTRVGKYELYADSVTNTDFCFNITLSLTDYSSGDSNKCQCYIKPISVTINV